MKKAEGLSISTVVIAAIALVVLIVLVLIFTGRIGFFQSQLESCPPGTEAQATCSAGTLPRGQIEQNGERLLCCPPPDSETGNGG